MLCLCLYPSPNFSVSFSSLHFLSRALPTPHSPLNFADDDGTAGYDVDLCLAGSEHTGRWTRKEHELFLEALKKYGKEWKKVASAVKTRTVVQTRTHAQKYFQKVHKSGFGSGYSDDDGAFDGPSIGSTARSGSGTNSHRRVSKRARRPKLPNAMPMVYSAMNSNSHQQSYHGSDMDDDYDDDEGVGAMEMLSGAHQFASTPIVAKRQGGISLSVPMGMSLGMNDDYPQPSPAACGKRKEAELTAAKMLASHSASRDMEGATALSSLKAAAYRPGEIVRRQKVNLPMLSIMDPEMVPGSGSARSEDGGAPGTPWEKEVRELGEHKAAGSYPGMAPLPVGTPSQQKEFLVKVRNHITSGDVVSLTKTLVAAEASISQASPSVAPLPLTDIFVAGTGSDAPPAAAGGVGGGESSPRASTVAVSAFNSDIIKAEAKAPVSPTPSPRSKGASAAGISSVSSSASSTTASATKPPASLIARTLNRLGSSGLGSLSEASGSGNNIKAAARTALMLACSLPSSTDVAHDSPSATAASIRSPGAKASSGTTATSHGYTQDVVLALCRVLIDHGASPTVLGPQGESCLHLVAKRGWERVGRLLLNRGCPVNAVGPDGNAAIHLAVMAGHGHFIELLADFGANCHLRNSQSRAALDLAGTTEATINNRVELRRVMLSVEPRLRTLLLYHEDCLEHSARRAEDWEGPDRLMGIMHRLQNREEFAEHEVEISSHFDKAPVELLSRVHSPEYIAFVDKLSKQMQQKAAAGTGTVVPFTPQVQKEVQGVTENQNIKKDEYCDTSFSAGTLQAARRAAGAVAFAVDRVLLGRNRNAFCCVRPPGHHAGYNGLLDTAKSCGFCIFNSVAAGAMHALEGHNCERVAIVDLDIHHGNGTEDIVRRYTTPSRLLFFSLHLYDKDLDPGYEFFPGSGATDDASHNIINVPILPMWHSAGAGTKTSTGSDSGSPTGHTTSSATNSSFSSSSPSHANGGASGPLTGREAYRQAIIQRLLPALRAFNPALILLSTGFDPALGDVGNTRNVPILNPDGSSSSSEPAMGMDLTAEDFAWVTSEVMKIADICCAGRVVSVLEGGYGSYSTAARADARAKLTAGAGTRGTRKSAEPAAVAPLDRHILANSCAAHVHKLIDAYGVSSQHPLLCNTIESSAAGAIKIE